MKGNMNMLNQELKNLKSESEAIMIFLAKLESKKKTFFAKLIKEKYKVSYRGHVYNISPKSVKYGNLWYETKTLIVNNVRFDRITSVDSEKKLIRFR